MKKMRKTRRKKIPSKIEENTTAEKCTFQIFEAMRVECTPPK